MYYTETITISLNAEEVEELTIKVMSTYFGSRDEWRNVNDAICIADALIRKHPADRDFDNIH